MIYLDNIIFSLQKTGGISSVWANLLYNLITQQLQLKLIEYPHSEDNIFRKQLHIDEKSIIYNNHFNKILSQFTSPKIDFGNKFIFHSSYFRTCNNKKAINVTTVHDFIYEQGNPTLKEKLRIKLNYSAIRKSDAIVCVSENTKKDLFKYLPDTDSSKVFVIHNGVSDDYNKLDIVPYPELRDSILFVGGRQSYKNFDFVVKSLVATNYKLIVCGADLKDDEKFLLEKYIPHRYSLISFPSNEELNKLYNSVYCLAYPSSYEGFGLPVLEAQRAGCPVIALNCSSIPEIIGETPILMKDMNKTAFLTSLDKLNVDSIRNTVIDKGLDNSKRYSWKKMADEYLKLYQNLLSNA